MMTSGFDISQRRRQITADIPEERNTHDRSEADPEKVRPIQMGNFSTKMCLQAIISTQ